MCIAVGCSVGPGVYQTVLVQVDVKRFAGSKFSGTIERFYDTVKFACYNTVRCTVTQDITEVDSVKYVSFRQLLSKRFV